MEHVINHILKDIYLRIPTEILIEAFEPHNQRKSLDGIIKENIIVDIVLRKCNIFTGKLSKIHLRSEWIQNNVNSTIYQNLLILDGLVYVIPPEAREFRDISYIIGVGVPFGLGTDFQSYSDTSFTRVTHEVIDSNTRNMNYYIPQAKLVTKNTVVLECDYHYDWILTCLLKFDEDFTNLTPGAIPYLCDMAVHATQMFIYNKLKIKIDQAYIIGGNELGAFKEIIDSYADAEEKFNEALKDFRGATTFDTDQLKAMLSFMF